MAQIQKPSNLTTNIWAGAGEKVEPDNVKKQAGWVAEIPPFQYENWLQNRLHTAIAHITQHGISVWDSATEYQADKSYVQGSDGAIYRCIVTHTGHNPVTDAGDYWESAFATAGELADHMAAVIAHTAGQIGVEPLLSVFGSSDSVQEVLAKLGSASLLSKDSLLVKDSSGNLNEDLKLASRVLSSKWAPEFISANTNKTSINFIPAAGSSDPGYIVHETAHRSGESQTEGDSDIGVIHLCPSDNTGDVHSVDRVSVHGYGHAEAIKLFTNGDIETVGSIKSQGSSVLTTKSFSNQKKAINGYQILPGGVILQWGRTPTNQATTYPISFPVGVTSIVVTDLGARNMGYMSVELYDENGFTPTSDLNGDMLFWIAFGY